MQMSMNTYINEDTRLTLKQMGSLGSLIWDQFILILGYIHTYTRSFVTIPFKREVINVNHPAHSGANASVKLTTEHFVWPSIKPNSKKWRKACIECQKCKIKKHVNTAPGTFTPLTEKFQHIHANIVVMPYRKRYRYCLTIIYRFGQWPEVIHWRTLRHLQLPKFSWWVDC